MKYIMPTSLTWWTGVALVIYGIVESIQLKTFSPHLIEGFTAIGIRKAISHGS